MALEGFKEKGNHLIYSSAMVRKSCLYFAIFLHHFYAIPLVHVLVRVYIVAIYNCDQKKNKLARKRFI